MRQPLQHTFVQSLHFSVVESDSHQGISNDLPKGFNLKMVGILIYVMWWITLDRRENTWPAGYHAVGRGTHSSANILCKPHRWCRASTTFVQETASGCSSVVTFFKWYFPLQATSHKGFSLERVRPFVVIYTPERLFRESQPHAPRHKQDNPSFSNAHNTIEPMAAPAGTLIDWVGYVRCLYWTTPEVVSLLMREHRRHTPWKLILLTYTVRCELTHIFKVFWHSLYAHTEIVICHSGL